MEYDKYILNSPASLRTFFIWLFQLPFWYVSFYLFNKPFLASNSLLTVIVFSLCFTLVSNFIMSMIFLGSKVLKGKYGVNNYKEEDVLDMHVSSITFQSVWLSIVVFVFYTINYKWNWKISFYNLIMIYYSPLLFIFLYGWIRIVKKKIQKRL